MPTITPAESIVVRGACEHNLQRVDVTIPRDALTVVTGLSGSGKSSLAFDTIYAEGQRRYMESLSAYARQYLDQMHKPKVEYVDGLSPAISIEQKTVSKNPRSTVGTVTEIYDYLRVLYANIGRPHCPKCGIPIQRQSPAQIVETIMGYGVGAKLMIMSPVVRGRKGEYKQLFDDARRQGFVRARVNGEIVNLEDPPELKKTNKHRISLVIDRLVIAENSRPRLIEAVELALRKADGLLEVQTVPDNRVDTYSEHFACPECGVSIEEITPRLFSFNSPYGACKKCEGLGYAMVVDAGAMVTNGDLSIKEGALTLWADPLAKRGTRFAEPEQARMVQDLEKYAVVDLDTPWKKLPEKIRELIINGIDDMRPTAKPGRDSTYSRRFAFEGIVPMVLRLHEEGDDSVRNFFREISCAACDGARLQPGALAVRLGGINIGEFCRMSIEAALRFMNELELTSREQAIGAQLLREIRERLEFLGNVGLHYLTLNRKAGTLSGGEAQRIRLATQIGSQLTGVLYVLDEPSIGLHQRDNDRLIDALKRLRDLGNTLIVVEHDEHTMRESDYIIDMGPGAGRLGGHIVFEGTPAELLASKDSVTGQYLRGEQKIAVPAKRRKPEKGRELVVRGAREHNLRNINVSFPLGLFLCITGVSGSGKSTLVNDILYARLANHVYRSGHACGAHDGVDGLDLIDKVVDVDQAPIGRTPRSNPATYTGVFSAIRDLFAKMPDAQIRGYGPGRFSFNVKGGRCEECCGEGLMKIEMHFLPDTYVECSMCRGRRFNRETLEVLYKGKSIADVLDLTIEDACGFFSAQPSICHKMSTLRDVGLGYLTLGQSATTLSGGEAQRVKLAKELSKRATGRTVYILDEPTTGLHFEDIRKLLEVLQALTDQGNTVIVIEHNLDVIKSADYLIDMGPEGGEHGGIVVAQGSPEKVAKADTPTAKYLAEVLS